MIKVGLDISQIAHGGGVSTYTRNLARKLSESPEINPVFFYSSLRKPYRGGLKNVRSFPVPPTVFEFLFNRVRLSIDPFIGEVDVFHSSDWIQPGTKAKKVTTYHDVVPLKYPNWSDPKIVEVHKRRVKIVEEEIDCVIAVSESTKKDLLELSKIPEEKIKVIYEGVDNNFRPQQKAKQEEFRAKYKLPEKFILAVGGVGERRNLGRIESASKGYQLIVSGKDIPWIPEEEMPLLYSSAGALAYVSLYEGFGLPILEAMACGCPVVTSNVSSMKEIAFGNALLADPTDVSDIAHQIKKVMENESLREDLISKGLKHSKKFSWEKCVEETINVYEGLLS